MSEILNDNERRAFESDLKALTPAASTISRDALLFRAGRESARRQRRLWMLSTLGLFVCLCGTSTVLAWQMTMAPERVRIVYRDRLVPVEHAEVKSPVTAPAATWPRFEREPPRAVYLQLRSQVARWGADGVPGMSRSRPSDGESIARGEEAAPTLRDWYTRITGEQE